MNRRYPILILGILLVGVGVVMMAVGAFANDSKETSKAFLGVVLDEVTSDIAEEYGATSGGALIQEVTRHSAAKKAGLRANDIIVKFDGIPISDPDDLRKELKKKSPGDEAELTFLRGGKQKTVDVILGERRTKTKIACKEKWDDDDCHHGRGFKALKIKKIMEPRAYAGIHLQELNKGLAKYFETDEGVLISDVEEDSPAEKAGIEAGDIIVSIDGKSIEDVGDVQKLIRKHDPGDEATFEIIRKGNKKTIEVELGEAENEYFGWLGGPGGPMMVFDDEELEEYPGDFGHYFHDFDMDEFKDDVNKYRVELQHDLEPQLEELKAQLQELKEEIQRLKREKFEE